jgi:hypothetical protein
MITKFYLPVLKSKQGEFDGLFLVTPRIKTAIVPLIEVTKLEYDNASSEKPKTIEAHLNTICKRIATKWSSSNAFIDTYLVNDTKPGGVSSVSYIYNALSRSNIIPLPVVRTSTSDDTISGITEVIQQYSIKEVGLRISISDLLSMDLLDNINKLLRQLNSLPRECHLILDLNNADFSNFEDFSDSMIDQLKDFPYSHEWKSFTISGGSFPATNLIKVGINEVPRGEWLLYKKILEKQRGQKFERALNYGDYGIVAPGHFEFDPTKMDRSANIRYTHNNIWYVIKGKSLKTEGHGQYFTLAKNISNSRYYLGENFSAGDLHLKQCSLKLTSTGSPTVWNKVGFNHHFSKVITDLSASYLAV